jgi:hypothetical protein
VFSGTVITAVINVSFAAFKKNLLVNVSSNPGNPALNA